MEPQQPWSTHLGSIKHIHWRLANTKWLLILFCLFACFCICLLIWPIDKCYCNRQNAISMSSLKPICSEMEPVSTSVTTPGHTGYYQEVRAAYDKIHRLWIACQFCRERPTFLLAVQHSGCPYHNMENLTLGFVKGTKHGKDHKTQASWRGDGATK